MAKSQSMTLTTEDDEEITVVVTKFESVESYELIERMQKAEAAGNLMAFQRKEMLACTYVVRNDSKGEQVKIDFAGLSGVQLDKAMNRAFRGTGLMGIAKAAQFSFTVNFAAFFAEAERERQAKLDAAKLSTEEVPNSD